MTTTERTRARRAYLAARANAARAASLGDRAGSLIAAGVARRILAGMIAADEAATMERSRPA